MEHDSDQQLIHEDEDVFAAQAAGSTKTKRPSGLLVRRLIGLALMTLIAYGLYWLLIQSGILTPLYAQAQPVVDFVHWVADDPKRGLIAAVAFIIPQMGLYTMLFERN